MLKDKKNWVILILLGLTIYLCFRNYSLVKSVNNHPDNPVVTTDTIYKPIREYEEVKPYNNHQSPQQLVIFSGPGPLSSDQDSLLHTRQPESRLGPELYDSISQILIKNNWLELTTKNTLDSTYKIRKFNIDTQKYNYNWVNNELTYNKKFNLKLIPYIKGSYRPFNRFTDLEAGINLETTKINYNLGLNLFYYPSLQKSVGKDLQISITYKFN